MTMTALPATTEREQTPESRRIAELQADLDSGRYEPYREDFEKAIAEIRAVTAKAILGA